MLLNVGAILYQHEVSSRNAVVAIELFLFALVLDQFDNAWLRIYRQAFLLELIQRLHVDVLDLDRQQVDLFAKAIDGVVIGQRALLELRSEVAARRDRRRIEHRREHVKIDAGLDQHATELAAAENAEFEILIERFHA
ncbi:MAG: hypothetical protein V4603_03415 [Pseudomonadota bacterium]